MQHTHDTVEKTWDTQRELYKELRTFEPALIVVSCLGFQEQLRSFNVAEIRTRTLAGSHQLRAKKRPLPGRKQLNFQRGNKL